ncbi:GNAT family N-acetyltransferase [Tranquillimonas alkanivorans]|uniref:Ribosomal protein S18 acetylase RimI n=1 Tax=Tranquillimonas alkanivorans TaxID=441119 RepID=A0A1I5MLA8_9RHOB|nr:GNAT family N-acetyltransferase [Tranquillimonas alkanivorans]SFP10382.1 Ribosomal protein S18 acetylase RimI [Tranquillimonas alkanivorans]
MTLRIRPLGPQDGADWRRLWRGYLAFYETKLPESHFDSYLARLLANDTNDYHGLIAEQDGRPVGLAHYLFHRHGWKAESVCYLQDLYADPQVRGQGVGRALIEGVYAAADAAGAPGVYWLTQDFNEPARRLYDRVGRLTPFIKYERP